MTYELAAKRDLFCFTRQLYLVELRTRVENRYTTYFSLINSGQLIC